MIATAVLLGAVEAFARDPMLVDSEEALSARRAERVELFALRGEYEPALVVVRSDAGTDCHVRISDLTCDGARLGSDCVEVARLEWATKLPYRRKDWVLRPATSMRLKAGKAERLWLTFHVPESAHPGTYRGEVSISFDGGTETLPVELHVLPARLRPCRTCFYLLGTVSPYGQYFKPERKEVLKPEVVGFYRDMKEHGMTGPCMKCSDWPYKGSVAGLEAEIEAALEAGLDGEVVWNMLALIDAAKGGDRYDFNGRMDNWDEEKDLARLREIFFKAKKLVLGRGWPEVILYAVDEPGTQFEDKTFLYRSMDILLKASKEIDSLGGRAHSTITECVDEKHNKAPRWSRRPDEMRDLWNECRPYLHVRNYGYGYPQGKTDLQHEMDDARHRGQDVWFYNNAAVLGRDRNCARVYWGLWGWKVGADGLTAWTHPRARTIQFELCREGIDDARYLALTEQLCLTLLPEDPARKEAEEFLARLRDSVKLDENGFVGSWADVVAGAVEMKPGEGEWKAVDFPSLKRALAQRIRALVEARRRYPAELDELRAMARTWRLTKANEKAKQLLARAPADEVGPLRGFDPGSGASLRRWVIKHGRGRWLKVSRGGRTVRAKVVSANLLGVQVRFMGEEMLARWENITPEELYRFCKKIEGPGSYGYAFTTPLFRRSASRDTGLGRRTFDAFAYSFFGGDL